MLKLQEIQHYPIGENGLKLYEISRGSYTGSPDIKKVIGWAANDILQPITKGRYKVRSVKPILFPLSSLVEEIEVGGKRFVPSDELCDWDDDFEMWNYALPIMYWENMIKLFEWKIDVFNLIGQGKAVSVLDFDVNPYK